MVRFPESAYVDFGDTTVCVILPFTKAEADFKFYRFGDTIPCDEDLEAIHVYFIVKKDPQGCEQVNNPFMKSLPVEEGKLSTSGDTIKHSFWHQAFEFVATMGQSEGDQCDMNFVFSSVGE